MNKIDLKLNNVFSHDDILEIMLNTHADESIIDSIYFLIYNIINEKINQLSNEENTIVFNASDRACVEKKLLSTSNIYKKETIEILINIVLAKFRQRLDEKDIKLFLKRSNDILNDQDVLDLFINAEETNSNHLINVLSKKIEPEKVEEITTKNIEAIDNKAKDSSSSFHNEDKTVNNNDIVIKPLKEETKVINDNDDYVGNSRNSEPINKTPLKVADIKDETTNAKVYKQEENKEILTQDVVFNKTERIYNNDNRELESEETLSNNIDKILSNTNFSN